jgi:triosephosphate isomerase
MKHLIVANWKMNPTTHKEAEDIFEAIKNGLGGTKSEVVICPPAIYLPLLKGLPLGAENIYYQDKGAFTGEISVGMLKDLGIEYVMIGHSERRKYFGETDEMVNKKIKKALEIGLKVIFCIGETQEEHDAGKKNEVLAHQLAEGLRDVERVNNISIAYEPVWAIGTGNNCSVEETKESIEFIKVTVGKLHRGESRVLYGGSVKSVNSGSYITDAGADGLLVGGASLIPEEFIAIIRSVQ